MRYKIIKDTYYPKKQELKKRKTVRALVINNNKIALLHIKAFEKDFGERNHLETPGGGIDESETPIEALHRELLEETGFIVKNVKYLTTIAIEYNPINRMDIGMFYSCELDKDTHTTHRLEYELKLFKSLDWYDLDKIDEIYETFSNEGVNKQIKERDLLAIHKYLKSR